MHSRISFDRRICKLVIVYSNTADMGLQHGPLKCSTKLCPVCTAAYHGSAACLFRAVSRNMCEVWATAQAASLPSSWGCHIRNNDESSCKSVGQGHLEGFSASTMSVTPVVEACSWILYAITDMWIFLENWFRVCAACYCVCDTWQMKQKWSKESALHGFCSMQSKHASKETQIRCWSENNVWENIQLFSKCIWVHLQAPYGDFASTFC